MARPFHSSNAFIKGVTQSDRANGEAENSATLPPRTRFGYFFKQSPDDHRLKPGPETVSNLMKLGESMREPANGGEDSPIPSIYTYFGQFIAHDLTFDAIGKHIPLSLTEDLEPMEVEVVESLHNHRTGLLDLDSIYGPGFNNVAISRNGDEFILKPAIGASHSVVDADLPRLDEKPYTALIGDPRNDENLALLQLHVVFLKAHNRIVRSGRSFDEAKTLLKRRYQNLVVKDFLSRIVREDDLKAAQTKKNLYPTTKDDLFLPIEFTAAAFRFGHSMIRSRYAFNNDRGTVPLRLLFTRNALGGYYQLLADWVIDWKHFVKNGANRARTFCPQLVEPLGDLAGNNSARFSLAVHDLLRGYLLGLPTGQALANAMGIEHLTEAEVLESAVSPEQREILRQSGFAEKTPLWFYMLAEAKKKGEGVSLGPVCGQLVALVLERLAHLSNYGDDEPWNDILGKRDGFDLTEFLMTAIS